MVDKVVCVHCGAAAKYPVVKTIRGQPLTFCCGGCVQVYEMLQDSILQDGILQDEAADSDQAISQPGESGPTETLSLRITGMSCANCTAAVERHLRAVPGVVEVSVVLKTEQAAVKIVPGRASLADLKRAVEKAGYRAAS